MADTRITQDRAATLTYIDDWSNRLTNAYPGSTVTIASATGSIDTGSLTSVVGTGTSVTFKLNVASVPTATDVTAKIVATLSNGDTDVRPLVVGAVD